jgi:N-acetylneuraminic acid mutarotase
MWTWVSGSDVANQSGVYGTKGTPAATNVPGGRQDAASWTDNGTNTLWMMGGTGLDINGILGSLNDLWKYNKATGQWTWVSGSIIVNQVGIYGTKGTAAAANVPGSRFNAISWFDRSSNTLWLFGGGGYDSVGGFGELNDLWKFSPTTSQWTWVSGSDTINQAGIYGTKGTAAPTNVPGARWMAVSWIDSNNTLWLFGGAGYDRVGGFGGLNDLWKFDPATSQWIWVSGSDTANQPGSYGAKGIGAIGNVPGGRSSAISWIDSSNTLWLFGGIGNDSAGAQDYLNDLWKFDGTNWTWVSGNDVVRQLGVYGSQGTPAAANMPGSRGQAISWIDSSGILWLFGGFGYDSAGTTLGGRLNDLWKFDGANWTWASGSDIKGQAGTYGTRGAAATSNMPGARDRSVSWIDSNNSLWLFGGTGFDGVGGGSNLNDLWRYGL